MQEIYQQETFQLESQHWWYRARQAIILAEFRRRYVSGSNLSILDIGCGGGAFLRALQEFGEVVGLDASDDAAKVARQNSSRPVWIGSLPEQIPDDLGRFDVACLFDVIEHIQDDVSALRSARTLLNPDGTLFVTVPALPWMFGIHDEINEHHRRYTRQSLTFVMRQAGFSCLSVSYFNVLLSPLLIPAICWRNLRRSGHHFKIRSRLAPVLQSVFTFERHLMRLGRLPFGLSLLAVAQTDVTVETASPQAAAMKQAI